MPYRMVLVQSIYSSDNLSIRKYLECIRSRNRGCTRLQLLIRTTFKNFGGIEWSNGTDLIILYLLISCIIAKRANSRRVLGMMSLLQQILKAQKDIRKQKSPNQTIFVLGLSHSGHSMYISALYTELSPLR